jgi:hypothetical protein
MKQPPYLSSLTYNNVLITWAEDGWCGYGPTYCGDGCTSNCDAHAECGQWAVPKDKKCPLNVCCSQHGFCGTTKGKWFMLMFLLDSSPGC